MNAEQQRAEFLKRLGEEATMHEKGGSLKDQRHAQARTMIDLGTHLEIINYEREQLGTALAHDTGSERHLLDPPLPLHALASAHGHFRYPSSRASCSSSTS